MSALCEFIDQMIDSRKGKINENIDKNRHIIKAKLKEIGQMGTWNAFKKHLKSVNCPMPAEELKNDDKEFDKYFEGFLLTLVQ